MPFQWLLKLFLNRHMRMTTGATSGAGTAYPSGAPEFTPGFSWVRVTRSFVTLEYVIVCLP
jgi:hypothetical protein